MTDAARSPWPELSYKAWEPTCTALQLWLQIVGKVRLVQTPWLNHSWHATFYLTARGLTTSTIPYGSRTFQADFDFLDDMLRIGTSDGRTAEVPLVSQSVADFHEKFFAALSRLDLPITINEKPNERAEAVAFPDDRAIRPYDAPAVRSFWRALLQAERVFVMFRSGFVGKVSPVHVFWGGFDLAVTRFSGRRAPRHPGGVPHLPRAVAVEAYSHEVSSAGFWPGGNGVDDAAFYSYAYPEPEGFRTAKLPAGAFYDENLREFILPYTVVQRHADPDHLLLDFLQSTYEAAANAAHWNRAELEAPFGKLGVPREV